MNVDASDKHYVVYRQMSSFTIESVDWFHSLRLKPYETGHPSAGYSFFVPELTVSKVLISQGTMKLHTIKIYQKLDVHSRREAVAKAHELELLAQG